MEGDLLNKFHPEIAKFVEAVLNNEGMGVCGEIPRIIDPKTSSSYPPKSARLCDCFKVLVPYAGRVLKWEVIFDHREPQLPPDFIFEALDQEFIPDIEEIEALVKWDSNNPQSLMTVILKLVEQYKEYQRKQVEAIPRLQFEYSTLSANSEYTEFEVDVVRNRQTKNIVVNFMIKIPVDLSEIPPFLIQDCPGDDMVCLFVSYASLDGGNVTPTLLLSPRVERAFGGASHLRIPHWGGVNGCLFEYLPLIHRLLSHKVEQVYSAYQRKREYVAAFLSAFGSSILEYDAEGFNMLSLLFQVQGFYCIVHIELGRNFPHEAPVFILQSIYHEYNNFPYERCETKYPYSPRWSGIEMAERARMFLLEKIPAFKDSSLSNGKF